MAGRRQIEAGNNREAIDEQKKQQPRNNREQRKHRRVNSKRERTTESNGRTPYPSSDLKTLPTSYPLRYRTRYTDDTDPFIEPSKSERKKEEYPRLL